MRKYRFRGLAVALALVSIVGAACASESSTTAPTDTGTGVRTDDLLARIQDEGVIRVSTDPAYPPQSSLNENDEWEGFDIDVATEIATRLGVTVAWETPEWTAITSGGWSDRWDMSVGSMSVTSDRAEVLDFSPAYYFTPASVAVHADNTSIVDITTDLDGKNVGACGGCTYDLFLQGTLEIPGYTFDFVVDDPSIKTYNTDTTVIQDLSLGDGVRLDAMVSALPTLEGAIDKGKPIKIVGDPLFFEPLAVAFDKSSQLDQTRLVDEVTRIIEEMHADGTLTALSMKWYQADLTRAV